MMSWVVRPRNKLTPIPALHDLVIANDMWLIGGRHGGVVCFAHEVLTKHVETVVDVFIRQCVLLISFGVFECHADDFLRTSLDAAPWYSSGCSIPDSGADGRL